MAEYFIMDVVLKIFKPTLAFNLLFWGTYFAEEATDGSYIVVICFIAVISSAIYLPVVSIRGIWRFFSSDNKIINIIEPCAIIAFCFFSLIPWTIATNNQELRYIEYITEENRELYKSAQLLKEGESCKKANLLNEIKENEKEFAYDDLPLEKRLSKNEDFKEGLEAAEAKCKFESVTNSVDRQLDSFLNENPKSQQLECKSPYKVSFGIRSSNPVYIITGDATSEQYHRSYNPYSDSYFYIFFTPNDEEYSDSMIVSIRKSDGYTKIERGRASVKNAASYNIQDWNLKRDTLEIDSYRTSDRDWNWRGQDFTVTSKFELKSSCELTAENNLISKLKEKSLNLRTDYVKEIELKRLKEIQDNKNKEKEQLKNNKI